MDNVEVEGEIWLWRGPQDKGNWHFLTIGGVAADMLSLRALEWPRGFGSVRVEAEIGGTVWQTSVFRHDGGENYILPIKAAVRKAEGIGAGDRVQVRLTF